MKIALFGGRFDPPHNGHVAVIEEAFKAIPSLSQVWIEPDFAHNWNPTSSSYEDRLAMCRLLETDKVKVTDVGKTVALKNNGKTYTIDIIKHLKSTTPYDYLFLAGSDQIPLFHKWKDYEELHEILPFVIIPRKGYITSGSLPKNCTWLSDKEFEALDDSSTNIREKIKKGESISGLVPKIVEEYIIQNRLYK